VKIQDFKTNYKPTKYEQDWTVRALNAIGHGRYWATSFARFKVDLYNKILTLNEWVDGQEENVSIVIKVAKSIGWSVNMNVEELSKDTIGILFTDENADKNLNDVEKFMGVK
jgi:hypothetical protein